MSATTTTKKRRRSISDLGEAPITKPLPDWDECTGGSVCGKVKALLLKDSHDYERDDRVDALQLLRDFIDSKSFGLVGAADAKRNVVDCLLVALSRPWKCNRYDDDYRHEKAVGMLEKIIAKAHEKKKLFDMESTLELLRPMQGRWDEGPVKRVGENNKMEMVLFRLFAIATHTEGDISDEHADLLVERAWGEYAKIKHDGRRRAADCFQYFYDTRAQLAEVLLQAMGLGPRSDTKFGYMPFYMSFLGDKTKRNQKTVDKLVAIMRAGPLWAEATRYVQRECPCCGENTANTFKPVTKEQIKEK